MGVFLNITRCVDCAAHKKSNSIAGAFFVPSQRLTQDTGWTISLFGFVKVEAWSLFLFVGLGPPGP